MYDMMWLYYPIKIIPNYYTVLCSIKCRDALQILEADY